ncbi:hypothetical protein BMAFMH_B0909 [Burkholderia mallei FMH]|nr:hypothetical protein BMAFMH_B0909 [Burkholderia mallei FMH]
MRVDQRFAREVIVERGVVRTGLERSGGRREQRVDLREQRGVRARGADRARIDGRTIDEAVGQYALCERKHRGAPRQRRAAAPERRMALGRPCTWFTVATSFARTAMTASSGARRLRRGNAKSKTGVSRQ